MFLSCVACFVPHPFPRTQTRVVNSYARDAMGTFGTTISSQQKPISTQRGKVKRTFQLLRSNFPSSRGVDMLLVLLQFRFLVETRRLKNDPLSVERQVSINQMVQALASDGSCYKTFNNQSTQSTLLQFQQ